MAHLPVAQTHRIRARLKRSDHLSKSTTAAARNTAIEDLSWVAINKVDFLFSY